MSERGAGHDGPTPPPTNTLAIISLVMGIVGVVIPVLGSITAVITGQVALDQIGRTGERGTGMAYWGVTLGWVTFGLWVVAGVLAVLIFWVFSTAGH